jgi:hypothetical protein
MFVVNVRVFMLPTVAVAAVFSSVSPCCTVFLVEVRVAQWSLSWARRARPHTHPVFSISFLLTVFLSRYSDWPRAGRPRGLSSSSARVKNFLTVQTDSGVHPTSYTMATGALSPEVKRPGLEADHSPPASVEVKKIWIYTPLPYTPSWRSAKLIKHRDNFTFYVIRCWERLSYLKPSSPVMWRRRVL